jgi:hypothetical protein
MFDIVCQQIDYFLISKNLEIFLYCFLFKSIMIKEHTVYDFISSIFVKLCFMCKDINLTNVPVYLKKI